ncbi:MAG TPA: hypothetical protein VH741_06140, partial [Candidatus Limnocylindrales bacterium]
LAGQGEVAADDGHIANGTGDDGVALDHDERLYVLAGRDRHVAVNDDLDGACGQLGIGRERRPGDGQD